MPRIDLDDTRSTCFGLGDVLGDAPIMPLVDDRAVIRIVGQRWVEFLHRRGRQSDELVERTLGQQDIIGSDAGLTGIEELAVDDALDRALERRVLAQDARRLAAKLKRHRCEIFGSRLHDQPSDRRRAGIKEMVERQSRECLADLGSAEDGRHLLSRKQAGQELGQEIRRARRQLRWLEHHPIAGRKRRDQRHDRQIERIVPRTDDADDADRLIEDAGAGRHQLKPDRNALGPHPASEVTERVADRRLCRDDFAEFGLIARPIAKVGRNGRRQTISVVADRFTEPLERGAPLLERRRSGTQEC